MKGLIGNQLKPTTVIDNGIKLLNYKKIKYSNDILYVGRLEKYKGVEFVLKAMPTILEEFPKTTFTIVGAGEYRKNLENLTKKLGIEKNVRFLGWVDHKQIESFYEDCSVFIMPSMWPEAFGKTGVEAMSMGRPVIASRIGGIPEWLEDNKTGFLVSPSNSPQIADRVIRLFRDKKMLEEFSVNARKRAEHFSVKRYGDSLEKTYKDLIAKS